MTLDCLSHPIPHLNAQLQNGTLTLAINRPEAKNALYQDLYLALEQALYQADACTDVRVVILRGTDRDFTAGNDMQDFIRVMQSPATSANQWAPFLLLKAAARLSKPLIIAVKGVAIGIGVTLLLHADFVYADPDSVFQIPFVSLGLSPEGCSSLLLERRAGYLQAADLILSARRFDAQTALQARLITAISADVYALAAQNAQHLAALPRASLLHSKAMMKTDVAAIVQRIDEEAAVFMQRVQSAEAREAVTAFQQKRKPDFSPFN